MAPTALHGKLRYERAKELLKSDRMRNPFSGEMTPRPRFYNKQAGGRSLKVGYLSAALHRKLAFLADRWEPCNYGYRHYWFVF